MKKIIACTLLTAFVTLIAFGQNRCDSVRVYFQISQWQFNPAIDGNAASMDSFIEKVRIAAETQRLDSIVIQSYSSPEGTEKFNQRLAVERCRTIATLIEKRGGIDPAFIKPHPEGIAWKGLRDLVYHTPDVPSREKILDIIDNTPIWVFNTKGQIISGRKKQLMDLNDGRPWRWMLQHLFPKLRNSMAVMFYLKPEENMPQTQVVDTVPADTFYTEIQLQPIQSDSLIDEVDTIQVAVFSDTVTSIEAPADDMLSLTPPRHYFALKTNLLYYGILLPNLELEWLINKHWSVAIEGNLAAWGSYKHEKSYRLTLIDAECRRWIKPRAPWHGMYVGLVAGGGWYDLEKGTPGHYGWGIMSGLTFGYMWPINHTLSLEAEIGAGYLHTRYKDYKPIDGHHVYLRTKDLNYFGPIKLKFSIVWRFLESEKTKRVKSSSL